MAVDFTLDDLLHPKKTNDFLRDHFGALPFSTTLRPSVLARMIEGFGDCELAGILPHCRRPDNSRFPSSEMDAMESDLESHVRTLDLPYCFTRGAHELQDAWLRSCADLGHDVEVGVYMSNSSSIIAEWHRDENHNFTIQLAGCKDWYHIRAGEPRADGSRGMFDPPRNRAESVSSAPPAGLAGCECFSLAPGSVLYLPPGHWHRVVPVAGACVSVNLRVGNLLRGRWLCEALFASLAAEAVDSSGPMHLLGQQALLPVGGCDSGSGAGSHVAALTQLVAHRLASLVESCPLPRAIPSEFELSDGLERAASLAFLEQRQCVAAVSAITGRQLRVSALVAIQLKLRGARTLLVHLNGTSALSGNEYLRFTLHCDSELQPMLAALVKAGHADSDKLLAGCAKRAQLLLLLRVLVHAHVLVSCPVDGASRSAAGGVADSERAGASAAGGQRERKRKL